MSCPRCPRESRRSLPGGKEADRGSAAGCCTEGRCAEPCSRSAQGDNQEADGAAVSSAGSG